MKLSALCFRPLAALGLMVLLLSGGLPAQQPPVKQSQRPTAKQNEAGLDLFKRDVHQILVGRCIRCHAGKKTEGELDLSTRIALLKGGSRGPAIVPGKHLESRLYQLVARTDDERMPQEGAPLSKANLAVLAKWIDLGAPYSSTLAPGTVEPLAWTRRSVDDLHQQYWAFQPLAKPMPPKVSPGASPRNTIDRFIQAKLAAKQLSTGPEAGRAELVRRAYLDLLGVPPTPEAIRGFTRNKSPEAYEQLIDDLLKSPQYGERWARHWLDVARFAESHGFEHDYDRPHAYHYRDFVIRALNDDLPYNKFVRWQLAGDELAPKNPLALMATGFLGAGVFPTQITANEVERTRYDALDDMLSTTGTAFLGLTIGCARCHDHKFDPIPQADYYRLLATFTTTVRSNIDLELDPQANQLARTKFDQDHKPYVQRLAAFEQTQLLPRFKRWEEAGGPAKTPETWLLLKPAELRSAGGTTFKPLPDGSFLATGKNVDFDTYTVVAKTQLSSITGFRLEALADPSMVKSGPGRAVNGNFDLTDLQVDSQSLKENSAARRLKLTSPKATFEQPGLLVRYAIDNNPKSGWAVDPQFGKDHAAVFHFEKPLSAADGVQLTFTLSFNGNNKHNIGRLRLALSTAPPPLPLVGPTVPEVVRRLLSKPASDRTPAEVAELLVWYRERDSQWLKLQKQLRDHLAKEPKAKLTKVMVCTEGSKPLRHHTQGADFFPQTYFLARGDTNHKRGVAKPGFLQVLSRAPKGTSHWEQVPPKGSRLSYRRSSLANWITDTEYGAGHLLARNIVNRLWQHHFQTGLVATSNDFGKQGTLPTHPQLLDWLAGELIAQQWRLKPIHKLIMTSASYRQSSALLARDTTIDPENKLLWRYPARRLEAEAIRDSMLSVSGLLDRTMFGPGTLDPNHKRRSIYFMVKRSKLIPMMQLFDSPEPLTSVGSRPTTIIAPQALLFLNNPQVRECSAAFAGRLAPIAKESVVLAVTQGYWLALGRPPTSDERADSVEFIDQQAKLHKPNSPASGRQQALTDFCQVLFSMNEFIYVR